MAVEAHGGGWEREARRAFGALAKRVADATGEDAQRLSVCLHRGNARAVLRRLQTQSGGAGV
eukprot:4451846-Pyramimonas_sp.AAC.1